MLACLNFDYQHLSLVELISTAAEAQDQPSLRMLFLISRVLHGRPLWISVSKLFVSYLRPLLQVSFAISVWCLVPVLGGSMQSCLEQMSHPTSQFLISPGTLVCNNNWLTYSFGSKNCLQVEKTRNSWCCDRMCQNLPGPCRSLIWRWLLLCVSEALHKFKTSSNWPQCQLLYWHTEQLW